ncbi:MAG: replication initiation protein, partial [Cetobacterium sp.]
FVLFTVFETFEDKGLVKIRVNDEYRYLLNQVAKPFTIQDVLEYTSLGSGYSQLMYSFLKEWEKSKNIEFKIDKFRELLGIPKGYRISEIDKFVLAPIFRELPEFFPNLKLEKIKTGRSVTSLKFTWSGKVEKIASQKKDDVIDIIEISDKVNKTLEKTKKNRFIAPLLTIDNIEILVQMFQEKDLIKGLNWSYREIKQEIKSLNYLIKSIKIGMEQKEKKLVVKSVPEVIQEQEILKENNLGLEKDQELKITEIEKIKITKDEYEELYKKFLQEQNTEHNLLTRKGFDIANKNKYEIVENEIEDKVYQFTIEELKKIPFEELIGKKVEIIANINSTEKRYMSYTKDPNDDNTIFEITEEI